MATYMPLFSGDPLSSLRDETLKAVEEAVDALDPSRLGTDPSDIDALVEPLIPVPAALVREKATFEVEERSLRTFDLLSRPRMRDGIAIILHVPFTGDRRFFNLTAAAGFEDLPQAVIESKALIVEIATVTTDEARAISDVADQLDRIETLLAHQAREVGHWRDGFRRDAVRAIEDRLQRRAVAGRTVQALIAAGYRRRGSEGQTRGLEPSG